MTHPLFISAVASRAAEATRRIWIVPIDRARD